ncbi:MAG: hypothetical protein IKV94_00615 [Clostridia bacterium]|nr:hypothetical protein [Clostridia bacterium]
MEVWGGSTKIATLKQFVEAEVERLLDEKNITGRKKRQIHDGRQFLKMLTEEPYSKVTKISSLKKLISQRRKRIKNIIEDMDKVLPGYQLSFFETATNLSETETLIIEGERVNLNAELKWLHKCLGICHNKDYFK